MNNAINYSGFIDLVLKSDDDAEDAGHNGSMQAASADNTAHTSISAACYRREILTLSQRRQNSGSG